MFRRMDNHLDSCIHAHERDEYEGHYDANGELEMNRHGNQETKSHDDRDRNEFKGRKK